MKALFRAVPVLFAAWVAPASAETHALIMTIGAYQGEIPALQGVKHDVESARIIARKMGVKDENIRYYKDEELTLAGMRKAFDDLHERLAENDQVFIYYSGHGGRQRLESENRCAASLVTVDGQGFMDTEVNAQLRRLSGKAQKIIVFLDACHSGGVTRGLSKKPLQFTPKFYAKRGADACETPVNIVTRVLSSESRSIGKGANNYVYIAAAREDEVSLDMETKGGVATQAWRDCITGAARDRDGSGGLSAEEIQQCAQEKIDVMLAGAKAMGILPHHVSIAGNSRAVLAFPEQSTPASASLPAPTPLQSVSAPAAAAGEAALPAAYHTLADIYSNRDDRRLVTLKGTRSKFRVGADNIGFTLNSDQPGYVYLLMVGTDGKTFDMLFPNQLDGKNQVLAGRKLELPRPSWEIRAGGPAGKNYLLAIVSDAPRDFSSLGMRPAGPFSVVAASAATSRDIQLVSATSSQASAKECSQPPGERALAAKAQCSNAYGAAMLTLEEID